MLITSRDLLRIEYLIGYDGCIAGVLTGELDFTLRVKMFTDLGEEIFFQRTFSSKTALNRLDKSTILTRYADEARYNLGEYIKKLQNQTLGN